MNQEDIIIKKCFTCIFDMEMPFVNLTEQVLGDGDEKQQYMVQLIGKHLNHISLNKSKIDENSILMQILPEDEGQLEPFANEIADEIHTLMQEKSTDIPMGSGVFLWAFCEDREYVCFFKLNYQNKFVDSIDANGKEKWVLNTKVIPSITQKITELFFIDIKNRKVQISNRKHYVENEKSNYLSDMILQLSMEQSEEEVVKTYQEAVIDTIQECYEEKAPEKIMEYKQVVAESITKTGELNIEEIQKEVFEDNEQAKAICKEKLQEKSIPVKPIEVNKKMEKKLLKKQKIVTKNGIEILVPIDYLKDPSIFEYHQYEDGTISILIKDGIKKLV
ncbi:MAG: nucleoid-associated protein [Firmicutes bacterium]|uniref:Nucleoid-associated protein n=1 Tax=Candidatus Scybalomonas excrementavium TaxID=2840943 RepID=A0A9D9HYP7_9FIRM|nr:nucleoid-associated protein [Candidatus Scybalomonas excrementavium]